MAKKTRNKWLIPGILIGILFIMLLAVIGTYNGFVSSEELVNEKWANVQTAYQRRLDLIPNLVSTVQASADFERSTLSEVTGLRTGISNAQTPEDLEVVGRQINSAINLVFEAYPTLRTTEGFRDLQTQLEGTENRIKTERDIYNKAIRDYNVKVRRFPGSIFAGMFGFEQKESFSADEGADAAVNVGELFDN